MIPRTQHPAPYLWKPRDFPFFCCSIFLPVTPKHQVAPTTTFLFGFYFDEVCFILIEEAEMVVGGEGLSSPKCVRLPYLYKK